MGAANLPDARLSSELYNALRVSLHSEPALQEIYRLLNSVYGPTALSGGVWYYPMADADITVGAEAANVINLAIQIRDGNGDDVKERMWLQYYVSSDANGDTVNSDLGTLAIGTDGTILGEHTDDVLGLVLSESDGDIDFDFTSTSAQTAYLHLLAPNGKKIASAAITHA